MEKSSAPGGPGSHRVIRKFAYLVSARWVRDVLQTVFLIYLARHSATTYGEFMLALGLGSILLLVAGSGLDLPLVSMLSKKDGDPGGALAQVSLLKGGLLILACLGTVGFVHWQDYAPPLKKVLLVISLGLGLEALTSTFFVAFQVEGRQDQESKIKSLAAVLGFGYGIVTLTAGAPPLVVAFYKLIETLGNLVAGAALIFSQPRFRPRWSSFPRLGATLQRGLIFALMEVTASIYNKANLFFLQRYGGADAVAQYSASAQLVDGIASLVSILLMQSVMFPLFVKLWDEDRGQVSPLARNTARWLLAAGLLLMFFLFIESDRLILLIFGPQYRDAVWVQKYLVFTIVTGFIHNLAAFLMMSMRRERLLLFFYLGGLVFNLLCCSLVMPGQPLLGAALAMVLTKAGVALLTVSYCQRHLGLLPGRALLQLAATALVGILLYLVTIHHLPRVAAGFLGMAPTLGLLWYWWRGRE